MADITNFVTSNDDNLNSNSDHQDSDENKHEDLKEIHIRVKKRNGRKCITTMEGLNVIDDNPVLWKKLFKKHLRAKV